MPVVQTPASLLEPHNQLIRECKAYAANHWQMQYNQTILNTAEYLQLLQDKNKRPLLESALTRTRESLEKLLNQVPEVTPFEHYGCFAAALMLDFGRPLADLAVYTEIGDEATRWNPLVQETIGKIGVHYDWKWTETQRQPTTFCPIVAFRLLPETGSRSLSQNPELLHSWIQTLQGRQGNEIAKIVNPKPVVGRNYVTPEERVEPFIGYLRNEIRAQRTNEPQYAIHLAPEGVFLRSPDIFQDYNVTRYATLQQDLSATIYVKLNPQDEPFWKCFSTSDGVWYGYLLDPGLLGIHEKVTASHTEIKILAL